MTNRKRILSVAIPTPLRRLFDYLPNVDTEINQLKPGKRVSVSFGKRKNVTGLIVGVNTDSDYPIHKLKKINHIIDDEPLINQKHLNWLLWVSRYYHHPVGEVIFNALPGHFKKDQVNKNRVNQYWQLTELGCSTDPNDIKKSPRQAQLLNHFKNTNKSLSESELSNLYERPRQSLHALEKKELLQRTHDIQENKIVKINAEQINLNTEQKQAIKIFEQIKSDAPAFLLEGITGSGKTEVYMSAIAGVIKEGKQCLVLLPEIGLTPQLIARFTKRFQTEIAIQHSRLTETERLQYWHDASTGKAKLILGTRSANWVPLKDPGLYIIDEEHDLSYKQQDGFRYSARDMLITRAKRDKVPIILGSATPSLETSLNAKTNRYQHLHLTSRAGKSKPPAFHLLDIRGKKMHGALSHTLVDEIQNRLKKKEQVLLFLNRRGYALHLYCHACAWKAECPRCDLPYTYHKSKNRLNCHHCDTSKPNIKNCPECGEPLLLLGHGTERIEEQLTELFPDSSIERIDRDTTRKKDSMHKILDKIHAGEIDILIGTQMLAKGHHFPNVTLTAIIDADRGLFSTDFRASERMAQLFMQVSGRTGRGSKAGSVIVQTYQPDHPLFHQLINHGYDHFTSLLLEERKAAALPPYSYMALLRCEAHKIDDAKQFIRKSANQLKQLTENTLSIYGPIPALIEKRSGRYRYQLVIQANSRNTLHKHLDVWLSELESMSSSKKVRWSLDIDPQDMN